MARRKIREEKSRFAGTKQILTDLNLKAHKEAHFNDPIGGAPASLVKRVVKTAAESLSSQTTLQNDDELFFTVGINETYSLDVVLHCTSLSSTPNINYAITIPSGTIAWGSHGISDDNPPISRNGFNTASGAYFDAAIGPGGNTNVHITGYAIIGATPGVLRVQWAQNVSNANSITVRQGSTLVGSLN